MLISQTPCAKVNLLIDLHCLHKSRNLPNQLSTSSAWDTAGISFIRHSVGFKSVIDTDTTSNEVVVGKLFWQLDPPPVVKQNLKKRSATAPQKAGFWRDQQRKASPERIGTKRESLQSNAKNSSRVTRSRTSSSCIFHSTPRLRHACAIMLSFFVC